MIIEINSEAEMDAFGVKIGNLLVRGEVVELVGDVGAGKTTLTKGIARGIGVDEDVQSPSFTVSRIYEAGQGICLAHYDFYRLHDAGIMAADLEEAMSDLHTITVIEWANIVAHVLPAERLTITMTSPSETVRRLEVDVTGSKNRQLLEAFA